MARFPYSSPDDVPSSLMPHLLMTLALGDQSIEVSGLLDSGAAVNVLPYRVGLELGANWDEQTTVIALTGSLGQF